MRCRLAPLLVLFVAIATPAAAQTSVPEPFKVGTFEIEGAPQVGIVLRDRYIVELDRANEALERNAAYPAIPLPADMLELISRYEYGMKARLCELITHLVENNMITGARPDYVHDLSDVRTLPPIMYPGKILNAAVNFYSHVDETGTEEERAEARRGDQSSDVPEEGQSAGQRPEHRARGGVRGHDPDPTRFETAASRPGAPRAIGR